MSFFENLISSNEKLIKFIKEAPAWSVKREEEKRQKKETKKSVWNAFNLVPTKKTGATTAQEYEYHIKMLCWIAADNSAGEYKRLFEQCTLADVYEIIMLKKALDYELHA